MILEIIIRFPISPHWSDLTRSSNANSNTVSHFNGVNRFFGDGINQIQRNWANSIQSQTDQSNFVSDPHPLQCSFVLRNLCESDLIFWSNYAHIPFFNITLIHWEAAIVFCFGWFFSRILNRFVDWLRLLTAFYYSHLYV